MAYNTYADGIVLDRVTMRGMPGRSANIVDAETGDSVQAYSMGEDPTSFILTTNAYGYFPQFQTLDAHKHIRLTFGRLTLSRIAFQVITETLAAALGAEQSALQAAADAALAASLVGAPADSAIKTILDAPASLTRIKLDGLYARGETRNTAFSEAPNSYVIGITQGNGSIAAGWPVDYLHVVTERQMSGRTKQTLTNVANGYHAIRTEIAGNEWGPLRSIAYADVATSAAAGLMSAGDKAKLDAATALATASTIAIRGTGGRLTVGTPTAATDAATKAYSENATNLLSGTVPVARLPLATTAVAGAMSAADKVNLDAPKLSYNSKAGTDLPNTYPVGYSTGLFSNSTGWPHAGSFSSVVTHQPAGYTKGTTQWAYPYDNWAKMPMYRLAVSATEWGPWETLVTESYAQRPNKFVEGVRLYSMGHSYTMYPYPYATKNSGEYYMRTAERLKMGAVWAKGRSSTYAIDNFARMLSTNYDSGSGKWAPNAYGICVIQNTMNELGSSQAPDSVFRGMWEHGIRSQIQLMRSKSIVSAADMTAVGTWTNLNSSSIGYIKGYDGISRFTQGTTNSLSTVVSGDECSIVGYINLSSYAAEGIEVLVNGTVRATFLTKGEKHLTTVDAVTGVVEVMTPVAFRVKGLNAWAGTSGNKTVLVRRRTGGAAENIFITAVLIPSEAPPMIFLVKEPPRAGSAAAIYTANIAYYNSRLDAIAAEYTNVFTVDFAPGWDNGVMIGSLDVAGGSFHPNDIGHSLMADHLVAAINQRVTGWIDGVAVL